MNLSVTNEAKNRINHVCKEGELLRISLIGGGCHGFSYKFEITKETFEDDVIIKDESGRAIVSIKKAFLEKLSQVNLDFKQNLSSSYFVLESPNFATKCGCGTSFAIA